MEENSIKVVKPTNELYSAQCKDIAIKNMAERDDKYFDYVSLADALICYIENKKVLGFLAIKWNYFRSTPEGRDLNIIQSEQHKDCDKDVMTPLFDYAKHHSKGYWVLFAKVKKYNKSTDEFYLSKGFSRSRKFDIYLYSILPKSVKNNEYLDFSEDIENEL